MTVTDDDKALDKIIRASMPLDFERKETLSADKTLVERPCTCHADDAPSVCQKKYALNECLIEAQAAEIERLREALGWFLNDSRFVVQVGGNPNVVPQMIAAARVALGETE